MSSLPPDASTTPQLGADDGEPDDSPEIPRWAVPAVPPPWAGAGRPGPAPASAEPAAQAPVAATPVEEASAVQTPVAVAATPVEPIPVEQAPAVQTPVAVAPTPVEPIPAGQPGYGQPGYGQPGYGQPGYGQPPVAGYAVASVNPAVARRSLFDRQKLLPTIAVAGIVAGVVLGGLGLDKVIAAPSAGTVDIGQSVTITAAPGWVRTETSGSSGDGVALQKSDAILSATAVLYDGTPSKALSEVEAVLQQDAADISFGTERDGTLGGHDSAMVAFSAIVSGPSGSGTVDGEIICLVINGRAILFEAVAPQGDLDPVGDDILTMVKSVEVGQ